MSRSTPELERVQRLLEDATGRDKVMRTVQYLLKLVSHLHGPNTGVQSSSAIATVDHVIQVLGDGRRLFRIGKFLSCGLSARKGLIDDVLTKLQVHGALHVFLRNVLLAQYYLLDNYIWFVKTKLLENQSIGRVQNLAMQFWSFSAIIALFCDAYTFKFNRPTNEEAQTVLQLKLAKTACDLPIVFITLLPSYAHLLSSGFITSSGCVSSIISLIISWRSTH